MPNLNYRTKVDLIEKYIDQEMVFQYCGFEVNKRNPRNPYRHDKHSGSCNWKWYNNILFFFDWTYPFEGKKFITIYGAVKLYKGYSSNNEAIDFLVDTFIHGIAESEKQDRAKLIATKMKKESVEDVVEVEVNKKNFPDINYYTKYFLNTHILKNENVYLVKNYKIVKNGKDITKYFPTLEEANGLIIAYKYGNKWKLYTPLLKKGIRKPRFWGNINAKTSIEGYSQVHNPKHKTMILLGSKKDYMVCRYPLHDLKADIYATQNEGIEIPNYFEKKIKLIYPNRFILFDADEAGYKSGLRILQNHEFTSQILLPETIVNNKLLKDPSDLIEEFKKEKTLNIIRNSNTNNYDKNNKSTSEADPTSWKNIKT